jgi:3-hydroxyacyl-CoA dehydrogenase
MGARIAAHLANASIPSLLLDLAPKTVEGEAPDPRVRNRLAQAGLDAALKSKPAAFFASERSRLITVGNFEDHLGLVKNCDWIIEAVAEDREIKRALLRKVEPLRPPDAIVSSNTSGISIASLAEGWSEDFRRHWLGTHFFNPPRYMRLLEVIPTGETAPEVVEAVCRFGDRVLGKGIVIAKDTPNFIANRIGTFVTLSVLRMLKADGQPDGYTIEEIDTLTGPAMGLPKSATFRTLDIVGLDVLAHVIENLRQLLPNDERRDLLETPAFVAEMIKCKLLGDKTGRGFYKKVKASSGSGEESEILTLDLATFEYRPRQRAKFPSLDMARSIESVPQRVAALIDAQDRAGDFYRKVLGDAFHYAAMRVPEIADDIVAIDRAMQWGFNWECGPFELWDAVGVEKTTETWKKEGHPVPPLSEKLLGSGQKTFYQQAGGCVRYFDLGSGGYKAALERPGVILLAAMKAAGREMRKNAGASLIDLGEGVLGLEFHSKMNVLGADTVAMIHAGLKALSENFDAMVIGNQAPNFSVGMNLMLLLVSVQEGEWEEIHQGVRTFQAANMALKYAPKPVVAAPYGLTLGGGAEICLHSARVRAAAESYMGLVEFGVGLIPGGGGTKEMLLRGMDSVPSDPEADPFTYVKEVFETIGMARVSTSAEEARRLGYLSTRDSVTMNRDRLIADAKELALDLVRLGYRPGSPREDVLVLGQSGFSKMKLGLHLMRRAEYISGYDVMVGTELARVLSGGGEFTAPQRVSEWYLLDLEREAFVRLCGQKKTVERMQYMLKKGKALRN